MFTSNALEHFGSVTKVAAAAGVTPNAVRQWGDLVPPLSAIRLERASKGKLKVDVDQYSTWNNRKAAS